MILATLDPQAFHSDAAAASATAFGGLIASGWHTAALMMRLFVDQYLTHCASLASPGIDELRWPAPVRPGDMLSVRVTVLSSRVSKSKPDRGLVTSLVEVFNQRGEIVMSMRPVNIVGRQAISGVSISAKATSAGGCGLCPPALI